jgi:CheY-like chemotaxis protein
MPDSSATPQAPPSVLIVEDDAATLAALSRLLRGTGHRVWSAVDALGGIMLLREHRPDRVLLDLMLPGMPGEYVLYAARAFSPRTRVAVLTGVEDPSRLDRLTTAGADKVMRKPVDLHALLTWVET